jgi:hypothetical protein
MWVVVALHVTLTQSLQTEHPTCRDMSSYQAPYVKATYEMKKHMGNFYELAFRDLYPAPPMCDCQHTTKVLTNDEGYYEEFNFACGPSKHQTPCLNKIVMTKTELGVYNQTITATSVTGVKIPDIKGVIFNTAVVAFKESNDPSSVQYDWVVEFTCGEHPALLNVLFPGGFVGLNMYSKAGPTSSSNLKEMVSAVNELGLGWTMESWGGGFHIVPQNSSCKYNFSSTDIQQEN